MTLNADHNATNKGQRRLRRFAHPKGKKARVLPEEAKTSNRKDILPVYDFGKIVATKHLVRSGQSDVYKGRRTIQDDHGGVEDSLGSDSIQDVAIKVYRGETTKRSWKHCKEEVSILINLSPHPNLLGMLQYFRKPQPAIVTRFVTGGSLYQQLYKYGYFVPNKAHEVLYGLGQGLQHLHSHNIVHRDFKSPNILLDLYPSLHPVIIDLGHGTLLPSETTGDEDQQYRAHFVTATSFWRPPEMITDQLYSRKTDMYALGIVMWEILTGKIPYDNKRSSWVYKYVAQEKGRPDLSVLSHLPDVTPDHVALMQKLWHHDPTKRPSATEFLAELRRLSPRSCAHGQGSC